MKLSPLTLRLISCFVALNCCVTKAFSSDPILISNFESETYGDWKTTGKAFGSGPARGTLPGQMHVDGFRGRGLVNSFLEGDGSTGSLTSSEFKIERKYIHFLIGGGQNIEKLAVQLIVDRKVVRSSTGPNDKSGGSEALIPDAWEVSEFANKKATIKIIDEATGGWGHINVDEIVQSDERPALMLVNAKREFQIEKRYIQLPIKDGAPKRKVTFLVDGHTEVVNEIELANGTPDWWAHVDTTVWKGKTLTIQSDKLPEDSNALRSIEHSDTLKAKDLYREALRPQLHFSAQRGWVNDPNGLVFFQGKYHLFYQHNPYGWNWGNMHWGHATSPDLVHWTELGDVLSPDASGAMFSGSAVVDWKNTSGFGKDGQPPLVLLYTAAGDPTTQCIAYSNDGVHFEKYGGNPVIQQISGGNRDPKVMWHEPTQKWVLVLYVEIPNKKHSIHFFTSSNLREWTLASVSEGGIDADKYLFECPDLFALPVDGNRKNMRWVLNAANSEYAVGSFDGKSFKPELSRLADVRGRGFYAAQTFSDLPDGRRVQIGWCQAPSPGMSFNQLQSIPSELSLKTTPDGIRLHRLPVKELESLRDGDNQAGMLKDFNAELIELRAEFEPGSAELVEYQVRGATIGYDVKKQELIVNDYRTAAPLVNGKQSIIVYVDRTMLEVYASDGLIYAPMPFIPKPDDLSLVTNVSGGKLKLNQLEVYQLKSCWSVGGK